MEVSEALRIINGTDTQAGVTYMPGWNIWAEDHTHRFEKCILVHITLRAPDSSEPPDYPHVVDFPTEHQIMVGNIADEAELCYALLKVFLFIHEHEAREFLRVGNNHAAPFHPHRMDGILNYAFLNATLNTHQQEVQPDLKYGLGHVSHVGS